jgi:protocatechuate 3,4-dioxygenase beta subunit
MAIALGLATALAAIAAREPAVATGSADQLRDQTRTGLEPGTAIITGIVIDDQLGDPVRRAIVTLRGSSLPPTRSLVTDDDGRFVFRSLPSGRYAMTATKAAYLESAYGAKRPGRPGTAIRIDEGQQLEVTVRIARGAAIEGTLRDEDGSPVPDATVYAFDPREPGSMGMTTVMRRERTATTDDRGVYRLFGLPAGAYVIASMMTPVGEGDIGRRGDAATDALLRRLGGSRGPSARTAPAAEAPVPPFVGYAPTYYPGVATFARATPVNVAIGEERLGIDFTLAVIPTVEMTGIVSRDDGGLRTDVQLSFVSTGPRVFGGAVGGASRPILADPPGPDGRFRYTSVPPGHYTIYAVSDPAAAARGRGAAAAGAGSAAASARERRFAIAEVDVVGQDVGGISLVLRPAAAVRGRIAFDAADVAPPDDVTTIRVSASLPGGGWTSNLRGTRMGNALVSPPSATPQADGTFTIAGVAPGSYQLRATLPAGVTGEWWLRSAWLDGRDLLDEPLIVGLEDVSGIVLTYTDRRTELTGLLQSATGLPATEYFIVAFPVDRALWQPGSRRFKSTRPDTDGRFTVTEVPAGTYHLAALTDFEPADFEDHAFLAELAAHALTITVRAGERNVQDVRVAGER